jgi:DNA-binding NarL/FixJ family response regulator
MKTKVIIADDHPLFADGVEQIINSIPFFEVVAKVGNGKLLMQELNSIIPDLILLDINMPYMNGIEAAKEIKRRMPDIKIVFLSMYADSNIISAAKENGINGVLSKDITAPLLKECLMDVVNGNTSFPSSVQTTTEGIWQQDDFAKELKLSSREIEIIRLLKQGMSNKQVSGYLKLSVYTIETHRKNIYRKLNLQGLGELIQFANEHKI